MSSCQARALDDALVAHVRSELPTLANVTYLNAGTLGPMPLVAVNAMREQLERESANRQPASLWEELTDAQAAARQAAARLGGLSREQVALSHSTHEGINAALWGLAPRAGDVIVTSDEEHPGVLTPLRILRERCGVEIRTVPFHADSASMAACVADAVDSRTIAVVVSHVSWVSGNIADLSLVRAACGSAALIVDGAQSAGAMPIRVGAGGADAFTISGQKWPLGPNGSGALLLADPERWLPTFGSHSSTTDPTACLTAPYHADARRLEHSQEAVLPLLGFTAAVDWLLGNVTMDHAHAHARAMNALAREVLAPALGPLCTGPVDLSGDAHLLVARVREGTAEHLARALSASGVSIRNLGDSHIRFSLGIWTTATDLAHAAGALDAVGELAADRSR